MREYIDYEDTLREGTDKLNQAIDRAYDADETAAQAKQDVDDTLVTVNDTLDEVNTVKDTAATLLDEVNTTNQQVITLADDVQDAVDAVDQLKHVGEYNAGTTYVKNNVVTYNGSSYFAKQETTGNVPTNTTYWGLLAQRGVDGEGAVASVNGMFPDLNGNVEIDIPDVSGLATKAEVQAVEGELVEHKAENATQAHLAKNIGLEDSADNFVATELEGAMNELFTNVSNGKSLVGGAITGVDNSVVIPTDPTFQDLASAIGRISTGKKWASGTVNIGSSASNKTYQYANGSGTATMRSIDVNGLDFTPGTIVAFTTQYIDSNYSFFSNKPDYFGANLVKTGGYNGFEQQAYVYNLKGNVSPAFVRYGSFSIPTLAANTTMFWIAFE